VIKERMREGLMRLKQQGGGSSTYPTRALLMAEPPSSEHGELTDKGYINQRVTIERRAALVERLYTEPPATDVIIID
jgi:feruloyl-CoA synthase